MGALSTLTTALRQSSALTGYADVLLGWRNMGAGRPRRIVLVPSSGKVGAPSDWRAVADETTVITAHIWGRDEDDCNDLTARLFQALREQADGDADTPGLFWKYDDSGEVDWQTEPDASMQGVVKTVTFSVVITLERVTPTSTGTVEAVQIEGTPATRTITISES